MRHYQIDFALTVLTGNLTRYRMLRPLVEQDKTVASRWYPIRTWVSNDPLRVLPAPLRIRARHLLDSWRLFVRRPADAVVFHTFEIYYLYAIWCWLLRRRTILVENSDLAVGGRPKGVGRYPWRFAVHRTALFVPWSNAAADVIRRDFPTLPEDRIAVLHPGTNLSQWPLRPAREPTGRFVLLFVGGDLERKGIHTLLDAFEQFLHATCALHIATQSGFLTPTLKTRIESLEQVTLHLDLQPGSNELQRLYREGDAFVLPTNGDASSIVAVEALATGLPVIITPDWGIPDIVIDGETGLHIPPRDPAALIEAVDRLRTDAELRTRLVTQGRRHVEEHFDAVRNTARLLDLVKGLIDAQSQYFPCRYTEKDEQHFDKR